MRKIVSAVLLACFLLIANRGWALSAAQQQESKAAWQAAEKVQTKGAAEIALMDQAKLKLTAGYIFIPKAEANRIMKSYGNTEDAKLLGIIVSVSDEESWIVTISYEAAGYIKDDDAKDWNADDLLKDVKEGTEEANKERKKRGFAELEITGWIEKPQYDITKHQLIWSMSSRHKGDTKDSSQAVNYNTYALGREGYLDLTLITDLKDIEAQKPIAKKMLDSIEFVSGKRYQDFNSSTDKVAEYGLAALIAGGVAKKVGLLALMAGVIAKAGKLIVLAFVGVGALFAKIFRRKKKPTDVANNEEEGNK